MKNWIARAATFGKTVAAASWRWATSFSWRTPAPYLFAIVEDMPDQLKRRKLYLIGDPGQFWAATMLCPCGCGERIELNLMPAARPRWEAEAHSDGTASLHPSIWRQKGCKSHFILKRGQVNWY